MPRRARTYIPGIPYHIVQRGNNEKRGQIYFLKPSLGSARALSFQELLTF